MKLPAEAGEIYALRGRIQPHRRFDPRDLDRRLVCVQAVRKPRAVLAWIAGLIAAAACAAAADLNEIRKTVDLSLNGGVVIEASEGWSNVAGWDRPQVEVFAPVEPEDTDDDRDQAQAVAATEARIKSSGPELRIYFDDDRMWAHCFLRALRADSGTPPFVRHVVKMPRTARRTITWRRRSRTSSGSSTKRPSMRAARRLLRNWVPPAVVGLVRKPRYNCEGVYASYAEAVKVIGIEYADDRALVETVKAKTRLLRERLEKQPVEDSRLVTRVAQLFGIAGPVRRLLDFGGALGTHYFVARALRGMSPDQWSIVEIPAICEESAEFTDQTLRFFASIAEAVKESGTPELVYSDGVLGTLPDPKCGLRQITSIGAPNLCVRRVPLTDGPEFASVIRTTLRRHSPEWIWAEGMQDGPVSLPMTVQNRREFEAALSEGYRIRVRLDDPTAAYVSKEFSVDMYGYFCDAI